MMNTESVEGISMERVRGEGANVEVERNAMPQGECSPEGVLEELIAEASDELHDDHGVILVGIIVEGIVRAC
jgi:hypothetical protein